MQEIDKSEEVNLYHHEIHKKKITRSAILELELEHSPIKGHKKCSEYINNDVANLLENKFNFEERSKNILLNEIDEVFTEKDNDIIMKAPTKEEINRIRLKKTI